jgi:hypothetical protein
MDSVSRRIHMTHRLLSVLSAILLAAYAPLVLAETEEHEPDSSHETTHDFHRNFVAGFIGATHEGRRENNVALGIGYERFFNESFAIGVIVEHTFGDLDFTVLAVPFAYRSGRWRLYIAPGVEDSKHGAKSLMRLGAEYAFEVGAIEVSPQVAVDFVGGEEVLVLGVVFGKGF